MHIEHVENMTISCCKSLYKSHTIGDRISGIEESLILASRKAGVSIVTDYMTSVSQAGVTFVAASIEGVENIPVTEYRDGVDVGFAYCKTHSIPEGFYTLRLQAEVERIGETESQMEFVDGNGRIVAKQTGKMDVFSLTVPENPPFVGNIITAHLQFDEAMEPTSPGAPLLPFLIIGLWCSNGGHWIIILV